MYHGSRIPKLILLVAVAAGLLASTIPTPAQNLEAFARARLLRVADLQDGGTAVRPAGKRLGVAAAGTITGTVRMEAEWLESAYVAAWPADSLAGDPADSEISDDGTAERPLQAVRVPVEPDGRYRLEVEAGAYYVSATAKEHETRYWEEATDLSDATVVEVGAGAVVEGINFALERYGAGEGIISGTVTHAADGHPVANAVVHAFAPDSRYHYGMAETAGDGSYRIVGLGTGGYVVEVWHPEYLGELYEDATTYEEATLVQVTEPGETAGIDFALASGGMIAGVVRGASGEPIEGAYINVMQPYPTRDDEVMGDDEPVVDLPVDGVAAGDLRVSGGWAVTGADGSYRVGGLPGGQYWVQAQASRGWVYDTVWYDGVESPEQATPVTVVPDQETAGIDFVLDLPVTDSAIAGRITDAAGNPVPEAYVAIQSADAWGADSLLATGAVTDVAGAEIGVAGAEPMPVDVAVDGVSRLWAGVVTDGDGDYAVEDLPAGTYLVSASAKNGWEYAQRWYVDATSPEAATQIPLADGERRGDIDITLPLRAATASLSGTVVDQEGQPLSRVFLEIAPADVDAADEARAVSAVWAYANTDEAGAYRVDRLPAGRYTVRASYSDGERFGQRWYDGADTRDAATPVVLADGEARTGVDLRLEVRPIYGVVAGTVTDAATGAAVERAYIELTPVMQDYARIMPVRIWGSWSLTDAEGAFRLSWIPEGEYAATVYADGATGTCGNTEGSAVLTVRGGETVACDAALQRRAAGGGGIAGRVWLNDGVWLEGIPEADPAGSDSVATADVMPAGSIAPEIAVIQAFPADGSQGPVATAVTRLDGSYELLGLAAGDYLLMSFGPGRIGTYYDGQGGAYAPDRAEVVHVDDGARVEGIDFRLEGIYYILAADGPTGADDGDAAAPEENRSSTGPAVTGQVVDDAGTPVARATVYLLDAAEQPVAFAQTAADGSYELAGAAGSAYRIYAGKPGFDGAYNGNEASFGAAEPLTLADDATEVNLVLSPATPTAVEEEAGDAGALPREVALYPNVPNPFNPSTQISFTVPAAGTATLKVYDVLGQQVGVAFEGPVEAGATYRVPFHADDLAAGVYFYALEFDGQRLSRPMLLVK